MRAMLLAILTNGMAMSAMPALAGELYRYHDNQGVPVLSRQGVPPEFIANGYQVLNEQGRVVREIPAAPSLEERKRQVLEAAQAKADQQLLKLYSSPADVERARDRKLKEHDSAVGVAKSHLSSLAMQKENLEKQAAAQERAGKSVSGRLLEQLQANARQRQELNAQLERLSRQRTQELDFYNDQRERLAKLLQGN